MVVNRLMYGCGAQVWYQHECDDFKIRQNGMGQWLWDVGNGLIRGETGWSTFEEREAKSMVKWMLKVVFEENLVSEIGIACLIEDASQDGGHDAGKYVVSLDFLSW